MKSRAVTYAAVGALLIVVFFAVYRTVLFVRKGGHATGTKLVAYFADATGLVEKSRVQIAGLAIGQIVERKFVDRPPRDELVREKRFARITFTLDKGASVFENAVVLKRTASLLGEFYLEIDPGTATEPGTGRTLRQLRDGDEIPEVREAITTDAVLRRVDEALPAMRQIAEDIRELTKPGGFVPNIARNIDALISENRQTVKDLLDNLERTTANLSATTGEAGPQVQDILENVREISREVRVMVTSPDGDVKASAAKARETFEKLSGAIDRLNETLENVADITGTVQRGEGTLGRLVKDDTLVDEAETTLHETGEFIRSVTRLQTIVGLRSEYNIEANTLKSYVQLRLQPRPDKFYLIEFIDDPRGSRDVSEIVEETDDPTQPPRTRTLRTEVSQAFRFTFQFAKILTLHRFSSTVRFGIKESTGGVGVDFGYRFPTQQTIALENDLFDVAANRFPRLKSMLTWEFFRNVFLVGGIDDILNDRPRTGAGGGRDYFVGAQLRFNDEDLRGLLFVGGPAVGAAAKK